MTSNDLVDWIRYHGDAFPSVADWVAKHPETVKFWGLALDGVDLRDAKAATDEMAAGTLDEPKGYGQHPRVIAKRARELGQARKSSLRVVDGQPVYGCPLCLDEGLVAVVDPRCWRDGIFRACSVYCTCSVGDRKQNRKFLDGHKPVQRPRYDRSRMFALNPELTDAELKRDFQAWLGGGRVTALANYDRGFDEYNEAG